MTRSPTHHSSGPAQKAAQAAQINDLAASCGVLGYQRTQQAAGNGPVEIQALGLNDVSMTESEDNR
jgi:hypothetical protein